MPRSRPRHAFALTAVLALLAVALWVPTPASADDGWQLAFYGDQGGETLGPMRLAVAPTGEALLGWVTPESAAGRGLYTNYITSTGSYWRSFTSASLPNETVLDFSLDLSTSCTAEQTFAYRAYVTGNTSNVRIVVAQRNYPTTSWARTVVGTSAYFASAPVVFCRGNDVTVIWSYNDTVRNSVWANQNVSGVWSGAFQLDSTDDQAHTVVANATADGSIAAAWVASAGGQSRYAGSVFAPGAGWTPVANLSAPSIYTVKPPTLAIAPGAVATFMHEAYNTTWGGWDIVAVDYSPGTGFSAPVWVMWLSWGSGGLRLFIDGQGRARVVNLIFSSTGFSVVSARRDVAGWPYPETIGGRSGVLAAGLTAAVDVQGNAVVSWMYGGGAELHQEYVRYVNGSGWRPPHPIDPVHAGPPADVQVGLDDAGVATFAWVEPQGAAERVLVRDFILDNRVPIVYWSLGSGAANVTTATIVVAGLAESDAQVKVNGQPVVLDASARFYVAIALAPGWNWVEVTAVDDQDNAFQEARSVTYIDPVPALEAALAAAEANATALAENITALEAEIDKANANASAASQQVIDFAALFEQAQAEIANLTSELNLTSAALGAAEGALADAVASLAAVAASGNATASELATAQANVTAAQGQVAGLQASQASLLSQLQGANQNATAALGVAQDARDDAAASSAAAAAAEQSAAAANQAAASAATTGLVGILAGVAGAGLAVMAMRRKGPPAVPAPKDEPKQESGEPK